MVYWIIWIIGWLNVLATLELCILMWLAKAILVVNWLRIPDAGPMHVCGYGLYRLHIATFTGRIYWNINIWLFILFFKSMWGGLNRNQHPPKNTCKFGLKSPTSISLTHNQGIYWPFTLTKRRLITVLFLAQFNSSNPFCCSCYGSEFQEIFIADYFITSLRDEVLILKELSSRDKRLRGQWSYEWFVLFHQLVGLTCLIIKIRMQLKKK